MWNYTHDQLALMPDELSHIGQCKACLSLFNLCVVAQGSKAIDSESGTQTEDLSKTA